MHIGYDIDGVLSKRDYSHLSLRGVQMTNFLLSYFAPWLLTRWVKKQEVHEEIAIAREISFEHCISVITARPQNICQITSVWLSEVAQIDYNYVYCVGLSRGFGYRKLEIAQKLDLDLYLDDNVETIEIFKQSGINAQLFTSWRDVKLD